MVQGCRGVRDEDRLITVDHNGHNTDRLHLLTLSCLDFLRTVVAVIFKLS